jgi:hypothetical protein
MPPFNEGDIVLTSATKHKDKFNKRRAKVVKLLSKKCRVRMLDGPEKGNDHVFLHDCLKLIEQAGVKQGAPAPSMQSTASSSSSAADGVRTLTDAFTSNHKVEDAVVPQTAVVAQGEEKATESSVVAPPVRTLTEAFASNHKVGEAVVPQTAVVEEMGSVAAPPVRTLTEAFASNHKVGEAVVLQTAVALQTEEKAAVVPSEQKDRGQLGTGEEAQDCKQANTEALAAALLRDPPTA